jgi:hypothetical protein
MWHAGGDRRAAESVPVYRLLSAIYLPFRGKRQSVDSMWHAGGDRREAESVPVYRLPYVVHQQSHFLPAYRMPSAVYLLFALNSDPAFQVGKVLPFATR